MSDLRDRIAPTEENVAALAREIERRFGYAGGTGWRARQALYALSFLLAQAPEPPKALKVSL